MLHCDRAACDGTTFGNPIDEVLEALDAMIVAADADGPAIQTSP